MPTPLTPTARVRTTVDGAAVVLTVRGALDVDAGRVLLAAVADAVAAGGHRLDIDLSGIDAFDDAGAAALLACRDAGELLAGGLHYRTCSGGPGQEVLLRAYADEA